MTAFTKWFLSSFTILHLSCNSQSDGLAGKITPLFQKDTSSKNERDNKLFVFVGEKIEVTPLPHTPGDFDGGVKAKYLVLQRVYGYYDHDTIEFEAYDHYGRFPFADYKNVLLYVSEYEGKLYQEKYMYDPVFKTKDGRWAGPYSHDYGHPYNEHTTVSPEKIDFADEVSFPVKIEDEDGKEYTLSYDKRYYAIVGDKAIAVYGNFVPDLFKLKKEGVLTARELFGDKKLEVKKVELKDISDSTGKK